MLRFSNHIKANALILVPSQVLAHESAGVVHKGMSGSYPTEGFLAKFSCFRLVRRSRQASVLR